ncbi:MAG: hypothetical protein ACRD1C_13845 [Terriglobales bacterium]
MRHALQSRFSMFLSLAILTALSPGLAHAQTAAPGPLNTASVRAKSSVAVPNATPRPAPAASQQSAEGNHRRRNIFISVAIAAGTAVILYFALRGHKQCSNPSAGQYPCT